MGDGDAIVEQCRDPLMQRYSLVPVPYDRSDAVAFVSGRPAGWADLSVRSFAIECPAGAGPTRFAGTISVRSGSDPAATELGFGTHPAVRGRGVMTAALGLVAEYAFTELDTQRLGWSCIAGNIASWRVAWRNGFRFEGTLRRGQPQRGQFLDCWSAALLSDDAREPANTWLSRPRLAGDRVVLRRLEQADERRYLETVLDAQSQHWLHHVPLPRDSGGFARRLLTQDLAPALGQAVEWAIADAETDEYVGGLGMFGFQGLDHASAEVGYRTHPHCRGRGVMTEALRLAIAHAFRSESESGYGLGRLSLLAGAGNAGSRRVATACGFVETGIDRRCHLLADGTLADLVRYDLLSSEWESHHP
jgi:RimJ/RimL family protein N-acetyltransferase